MSWFLSVELVENQSNKTCKKIFINVDNSNESIFNIFWQKKDLLYLARLRKTVKN